MSVRCKPVAQLVILHKRTTRAGRPLHFQHPIHHPPLRLILLLLLLTLSSTMPALAQETRGQEDSAPILVERIGVVRGQGALLLQEADRTAKAVLPAGSLVMLTGRSEDGSLLFVESGEYGNGWVAAGSLLTVNTTELPMRTNRIVAQPTHTVTEGAVTEGATTEIVNTIDVAAPAAPTTASAPNAAQRTSTAITAQVTLADSRLNLRAGPGTNYPVVAQAQPGSGWQVIGRNNNSDWLALQSSERDEPVWGATSYFALDGPVDALPVTAAPPPPTPSAILLPTPTANQATTQTVGAQSVTPNPSTNGAPAGSANGQTGLTGTLVFNDRIGGTIYAYRLDTDTLWPITTGIDPAISPDGQLVAFTRDGGGNGVYVINIDGSNERLLYRDHELLRSPKWSPDGRYLVFSRSNGYDDCRVLEGGVCLPDDALLESLPPELQTGEARNAVRGLPNQRSYRTVLSRIGLDGEGYRDIPALDYAAAPDWTDAGIVYHASRAGIQQTADADVMSRLVVDDELHGYFFDPDWQPGGGRIAFTRKLGSHWQIHLVNPDGTGLVAITRPVTALVDELPSNVAPAWSPDGRHIVYVSNRNSIESAGAWHFWVMNGDGADQRMLPVDLPLEYTFSAEQLISWGP